MATDPCRLLQRRSLCLVLIDDMHDRTPRRPDKKFTEVVLGCVRVCFEGLIECDAVNGEISMSGGDCARNVKPGCRVCVFLAIERVQCAGSRVSGIEAPYISSVVGRVVA